MGRFLPQMFCSGQYNARVCVHRLLSWRVGGEKMTLKCGIIFRELACAFVHILRGTSRSCALLLDVYGPLLLCCATCSFGVHFMRPLRWFYIFVKLSCFLCYGELYSTWPFREKRTLLSQHYKSFTGPLFCLKRWMGVWACLLSFLFIYVLVPLPNNAVNLQ